MNVEIAWITPANKTKHASAATLQGMYLERIQHFALCSMMTFPSEGQFLESIAKRKGRQPHLILLDSRGKLLTSEAFAKKLGELRDSGTALLVFAIGPADGWSAEARANADLLLSFGPMTLPHELARIVLAEQIYRAFTILTGHPYHSGH